MPTEIQIDDALSDEAIEWLVRIDADRADDAVFDAFQKWRQLSAEHETAAREAEAIWNGVSVAGQRFRRQGEPRIARRTALGGLLFISAGAALVRSGFIRLHPFCDYVTDIGEQRTIELADGSSVQLNARSAMSTFFEDAVRKVRLDEGQATFTVVGNHERPFVVEAGSGTTTALGTVFDVDIGSEAVAVTVVEGAVSVRSGRMAPLNLRADRRVRYTEDGDMTAPEDVDPDVELAWRRGKLIFNGRRLADVAAEIERYRAGRVIIAGEALKDLKVTGVFDLNDPASITSIIRETLPVRVNELPLLTVIRSI